MKVACLREILSRGLGATGGAIPSRTAMDILRNVLIDPWETRLKISGTNLETTITPWTEAQGAYSRERRPVCAHRAPGPHCRQAASSTVSAPGNAGPGDCLSTGQQPVEHPLAQGRRRSGLESAKEDAGRDTRPRKRRIITCRTMTATRSP